MSSDDLSRLDGLDTVDDLEDLDDLDEVERIAVVGYAGRFPGAPTVEQFWENLRNGVESLHAFTDDELDELGIPAEVYRQPNFVRLGTKLPDMDRFDAAFFGFTPREASIIEPQSRVFLETCYHALEHAGYNPYEHDEPIGVFAGSNPIDYATLLGVPDVTDSLSAFDRLIGTDKDFLATRVSHRLNLTGPALNIQTACSTSLVTIHLAVQSLMDYQCSMALAGGVSVNLRQGVGYFSQQGMITSPDGHCRAFDAGANGTTLGQAAGAVVLKRLSDALADGDTVHAVVLATALNNDGSNKVSYTAPSEDGQAEVITMAHTLAGVAPHEITYVETHGTGTPLGDPIEIAGLRRAFADDDGQGTWCALGSVKTNVGHTDAAAGVTGFLKAVLMLEHGELVPSLHYETPNPALGLETTPFFVNTELRPWEPAGARRAGVSSFGIGGTNAHAVLEEPPPPTDADAEAGPQLLVLSAKSRAALDEMTSDLAEHLADRAAAGAEGANLDLADVAYTLQVGRAAFEHRRTVVVAPGEEPGEALRTLDRTVSATRTVSGRPDTVFMFSGQGAQYPGMGSGLYRDDDVFREVIDETAALFAPHLGFDLRELIFADGSDDAAAERLKQTAITQPALFTVEYAMSRQLMAWGVEPAAVVGHSVGEYAAACVADVMDVADAVRAVATRGRLMQEMESGAMLAVQASHEALAPLLGDGVELAAANAPELHVVSGPHDVIDAFEERLAGGAIRTTRLHTSHAFHSAMMEPMLASFQTELEQLTLRPPTIPMLSNVTGTWLTAEEATDPAFWSQQIRRPVRFSDNIGTLFSEGTWTCVEVGPGRALTGLVRQRDDLPDATSAVNTLRHPMEDRDDAAVLLDAVGRMWTSGVTVDWPSLHPGRRRRVPLPTYRFQRQRHWAPKAQHVLALTPGDPAEVDGGTPHGVAHAGPVARTPIERWLYVPSWRRVAPAVPSPPSRYLVFSNGDAGDARLIDDVRALGGDVTTVVRGTSYAPRGDGFEIDPTSDDHHARLFADLAESGYLPDVVVHLWSAASDPTSAADPGDRSALDAALDEGLFSVLAVAQSLGAVSTVHPVRLEIVTVGAHDVFGDEGLRPAAAALCGPAKVIPLEFPNVSCRLIDLDRPVTALTDASLLVAELTSECAGYTIALRGRHRWEPGVDCLDTGAGRSSAGVELRDGGAYLIVGGLGGVGLSIGKHLAERYGARLALTSRRGRPTAPANGDDPELAARLTVLEEIEGHAPEVLVLAADAADEGQMRSAVEAAEAAFGHLDGVIVAAGVADMGGVIQRRSRDVMKESIASKVYGTAALLRAVTGRRLDFVVLSSSIATALYHNRFAQVGYVTANSYVEASGGRTPDGTPVIAVAWDDWLDIGMSVRAARSFAETYGSEVNLVDELHSFSPAEGVELFERALAAGEPLVYVSTTDLARRIADDVHVTSPFLSQALASDSWSGSVDEDASVAEVVTQVWRDLLGFDDIGEDEDFFDLGGDSLQVARMVDRLGRMLGVELDINAAFEARTVRRLSELVEALRAGETEQGMAGSATATDVAATVMEGAVPLSPGQRRYLLRGSPNPDHFNVSSVVDLGERLEVHDVQRIVDHLGAHHDALRLRISPEGAGWSQECPPARTSATVVSTVDLSELTPEDRRTRFTSEATAVQESLDLAAGPVARFVLFDFGDEGQRLLLVVHHLAADRMSLLLLLDHLDRLVSQVRSGTELQLPPRTASFRSWVEHQREAVSGPGADEVAARWHDGLTSSTRALPIDIDPAGVNSNSSGSDVRLAITGQEAEQLLRADGARVDELLLVAIGRAIGSWIGSSHVVVDTMGHGRRIIDGLDVHRTVGFFLTYDTVVLDARPDQDLDDVVAQLRGSAERAWTLDALRTFGAADRLASLPRAEVLYNFVGRSIETAADAGIRTDDSLRRGPEVAVDGRRDHPIAVYAEIVGDSVELAIVYSTALHRRETIERLAASVRDHVRALVVTTSPAETMG